MVDNTHSFSALYCCSETIESSKFACLCEHPVIFICENCLVSHHAINKFHTFIPIHEAQKLLSDLQYRKDFFQACSDFTQLQTQAEEYLNRLSHFLAQIEEFRVYLHDYLDKHCNKHSEHVKSLQEDIKILVAKISEAISTSNLHALGRFRQEGLKGYVGSLIEKFEIGEGKVEKAIKNMIRMYDEKGDIIDRENRLVMSKYLVCDIRVEEEDNLPIVSSKIGKLSHDNRETGNIEQQIIANTIDFINSKAQEATVSDLDIHDTDLLQLDREACQSKNFDSTKDSHDSYSDIIESIKHDLTDLGSQLIERMKQEERSISYTDFLNSQSKSMTALNQIEDRFKISSNSKSPKADEQALENIDLSKVTICENKTEALSDRLNPFLNPDAAAAMKSENSDIEWIFNLTSLSQSVKSQPMFGNSSSIILPSISKLYATQSIYKPEAKPDNKTPLAINRSLELYSHDTKPLDNPTIPKGGYNTYSESSKPIFKLPHDSKPSSVVINTDYTSESKLVPNPILSTQATQYPNIKKSDHLTSVLFHTEPEERKYPYQSQGSRSIGDQTLIETAGVVKPIISDLDEIKPKSSLPSLIFKETISNPQETSKESDNPVTITKSSETQEGFSYFSTPTPLESISTTSSTHNPTQDPKVSSSSIPRTSSLLNILTSSLFSSSSNSLHSNTPTFPQSKPSQPLYTISSSPSNPKPSQTPSSKLNRYIYIPKCGTRKLYEFDSVSQDICYTDLADQVVSKFYKTGCCILPDGSAMLVGGYNYTSGFISSATYRYNSDSASCESLQNLHTKRGYISLIVHEDWLYAFGGSPVSTAERMKWNGSGWERLPGMKEGRYGFGCCILDNRIYLIGGKFNTTIEYLNLYNLFFYSVKSVSIPRGSNMVFVDKGRVYVVRGYLMMVLDRNMRNSIEMNRCQAIGGNLLCGMVRKGSRVWVYSSNWHKIYTIDIRDRSYFEHELVS